MLRMTKIQNVCLSNTVNTQVCGIARLSRNGLGISSKRPYLGKRPLEPTLLPAEPEAEPAPAACPGLKESLADTCYLSFTDSSMSTRSRWSGSPVVVTRGFTGGMRWKAKHQAHHQRIATHIARVGF